MPTTTTMTMTIDNPDHDCGANGMRVFDPVLCTIGVPSIAQAT